MNQGKNSYHPLYNRYRAMRSRCENEAYPAYKWYGGRGIKVCRRWKNFDNFIEDMGMPKKGMTLDRIDNDGDYSKENCRWTSWEVQAKNKRVSQPVKYFKYEGKNLNMSQLAKIAGLSYLTFNHRLTKLGWDLQKAIHTPKGKYPKKRASIVG